MRRPAAAFATILAAAACTHQPNAGAPAGPVPSAGGPQQGAPRGGSSALPVLIGVVIGIGLVALLLSDEGGGAGYAALPPG